MEGCAVEVREVSGARGSLPHVVPTVWRADATTVCILLDNPNTGRWLVITLDVREESAAAVQTSEVT